MENSIKLSSLIAIVKRIQYPNKTARGVSYFVDVKTLISEVNDSLDNNDRLEEATQEVVEYIRESVKDVNRV
jgi:hypothetical protein